MSHGDDLFLERHKPADLEVALQLLRRKSPPTVPLARGVYLKSAQPTNLAVVDLQCLGLDGVHPRGVSLEIGAMVSLSQLLEEVQVPSQLQDAVRLEAPEKRQLQGTVGGTLVVADGRSPLGTVLLAIDARLVLEPGQKDLFLGDFLPLRESLLAGSLITKLMIPTNVSCVYRYQMAADERYPVVGAAVARWPSGRTRVALGGYGPAPVMAFDSQEDHGVAYAVTDAFSRVSQVGQSAEALQETIVALTLAGLESLKRR